MKSLVNSNDVVLFFRIFLIYSDVRFACLYDGAVSSKYLTFHQMYIAYTRHVAYLENNLLTPLSSYDSHL